MMPDREMMPSPPSGLCACRAGDEYLHIAAISPRCVVVRVPEGQNISGALTLQLYLPETGRYETHTIHQYHAGNGQHFQDAALFRLSFSDDACAAAIRRCMNAYARYLETKSTLGAAAWAQEIAAYPADGDDVFFPSLQEQCTAWFSALPPLPQPPEGVSLAVELNCPELWEMYLAHPLPEFIQAYSRRNHLPEGFLPESPPNRLYIGSNYCRHLFPDECTLQALIAKACAEGLDITIVGADMPAGEESKADAIIRLARSRSLELMINDWGMLHRAAGKCAILLGPLLNRRRKDPRFRCKPGMDFDLLRQNSLHSDAWRNFLAGLGVRGYAWENAPVSIDLPEGINCLHLPFYQTNTSRWCPLQAMCLRGSRGNQQPSEDCAQWCRQNALLYPAHLGMLGRWNSLLALGDLPETAILARHNRWVLNF